MKLKHKTKAKPKERPPVHALKHSQFSKINLIVFALIFAAIGGYAIWRSLAAGTVAVWVSPAGDDTTCVRGDQTKPCATFDKANKIAQNGDVVEVEAGTYPHQALLYNSARTVTDGSCSIMPTGPRYSEQSDYSQCVTFKPAPGATVNVDGIGVYTSGIRIQGFNLTNPGTPTYDESVGFGVSWINQPGGSYCKTVPQPHDVVFDDLRVSVSGGTPAPGTAPGAAVGITGVYNIAVINSNFGPVYDNHAVWQLSDLNQSTTTYCAAYTPEQLRDYHIYIGHNYMHDLIQDVRANSANCSGDITLYLCNHIAGIHWRASNSWLIGNKFTNIAQQALEVQTFAPSVSDIHDSVFANNIFGAPCSNQPSPPCGKIAAAIFIAHDVNSSLTNDVIAFNSMEGALQLQNDPGNTDNPNPFPGTIAFGNMATNDGGTSCAIGATFVQNAIAGTPACGTDFSITALPYKNSNYPAYDFSLSGSPDVSNKIATSTTVGTVTAYCPATDYAGNPRPAGANTSCAAGAYEAGSISDIIPGDLNKDGHVNVLDLSMLLSHWQSTDTTADINASGKVDILDLSILLSHYGT